MDRQIENSLKQVNLYLEKCLKPTGGLAKTLERAMQYCVFPGGKRIRPLLVLAVAKILGVPEKKILPAACGIELIHCFSLVHDDLPCMDNDDFRRGKPTCHKKFGQSQALLTGDALLCLGIREIARCNVPEAVIRTCNVLGSDGMAGGQSLDMIFKNKRLSQKIKLWIDRKKTGELFSLCFEIPAIIGNCEKKKIEKLQKIGMLFGLAFQVLDDILDKEGEEKKLRSILEKTVRKILHETRKFDTDTDMLIALIKNIFGSFVKI